MSFARTLPLVLSLAALGISLQESGGQEGRSGEGARPERPRLQPDEDERPPGVGNRDVGRLDIFGRPLVEPTDTIAERIQGGWVLTEMELQSSDPSGRVTTGFLHVGRAYLSLEIHAYWTGPEIDTEYDIHSSFTAEYTLDATGALHCRTIIGGYLDEETGILEWESPGFPRIFQVVETDRELILTWDGAKNRLVFRPRAPMMRGRADIFGRRRPVEPGDATFGRDVFGREQPDPGGVRDIFGRRVPPPEDPEDPDDPKDPEKPGGDGRR